MVQPKRGKVDYNQIASSYDQRYAHRPYAGIEHTLREMTAAGCTVLEVGCGTGHWLRFLKSCGCQVIGLDVAGEMLRLAAAKVHHLPLLLGSAEFLPFRAHAFDRLIMVNVLHHLSSARDAIHEAYRVLRPGGKFVLFGLDPSTGLDDWYVYDYFDGVLERDRRRYPNRSSVRGWFEAAGFERIETSVAHHINDSVNARQYLERGSAAKHSTSQLALLSDEEYQTGIDRIRADIRRAEDRGQSLHLRGDLRIYVTVGVTPTEHTSVIRT